NPAVDRIRDPREDDEPGCGHELAACGRDDRPDPEEQVAERQRTRNDDDALLQAWAHRSPRLGGCAGSCTGNASSVYPVSLWKTSRYRAEVASMTSGGRFGGGGCLSHSPRSTRDSR